MVNLATTVDAITIDDETAVVASSNVDVDASSIIEASSNVDTSNVDVTAIPSMGSS